MAIFKSKESEKQIFFVHIPRTGGRLFQEHLFKNNWELVLDNFYQTPTKPYEGIELRYMHANLYKKWTKTKNIPHFTIVRDPFERFVSTSKFLIASMELRNIETKKLYDEEEFNYILDSFTYHIEDTMTLNLFRPQVEFVTSDTNIWKNENGLDEEFFEWISNIIGERIEKKEVTPKGNFLDGYGNYFISNYMNNDLMNNIEKYYKKDYEFFYI